MRPLFLFLCGNILLSLARGKPDPRRPGEVHPEGKRQPPPVFPEGFKLPDGTIVDPADDAKMAGIGSASGDTRGRDRLLSAVYLGDVSTVDGLLQEEESGLLGPVAQVQVNRLETTNGRSALMQCAFDPQSNSSRALDRNCTTIAKRLVGAGADVALVDKHGWNVIAFGAMKGFTSFIRYLLRKGADVNNRDSAGRTPLMKAVTHGHENTTALLLQEGADAEVLDAHGWSVLHFSTRQLGGDPAPLHYWRLFELLLGGRGVPLDAQDSDGRTALMYAALMDSPRALSSLLEAGADPTLVDSSEITAYGLCRSEEARGLVALAAAAWAARQHEEWLALQLQDSAQENLWGL